MGKILQPGLKEVFENAYKQHPGDWGVPLFSAEHPRAPWWKRWWARLFHRDVRKSALEEVFVDMHTVGIGAFVQWIGKDGHVHQTRIPPEQLRQPTVVHWDDCPVSQIGFVPDVTPGAPDQCNCKFGERLKLVLALGALHDT